MNLVPKEIVYKLWSKGIKFQIKEGGTMGDFVLLQNVTLTSKRVQNRPGKSMIVKRFQ